MHNIEVEAEGVQILQKERGKAISRYIERDKLISNLKELPEQERIEYMGIYDCIRSQPTADVVEVVRCKDCFFYQKDKELAKANYLDPEKYCALLICEIDKNGFCSYGKKNGR